jgi:hypothetical protein
MGNRSLAEATTGLGSCTPVPPHGTKRSVHFAGESTLVAHWRGGHTRAQPAVKVIQSSRISGEGEGDLHILLY